MALRSWPQFFVSFAVKKNITAKNAKDSQKDAKQVLRARGKLSHDHTLR